MKVVNSCRRFRTSDAFPSPRALRGYDRALLDVAGSANGSALELLDAERDGASFSTSTSSTTALTMSPVLEVVDHLLAREASSRDRTGWTSAVDVALEPRNRPNSSCSVTSPSTVDPTGNFFDKTFPWIAHGLLEPKRNPALDRIDFENLHFDFLRWWKRSCRGACSFWVHDISETWIRLRCPASSSDETRPVVR